MKRTALSVAILSLAIGATAQNYGQGAPQNPPAAGQGAASGQAAPAQAAPAGAKRPPQAKTQPEYDAYNVAAANTDASATEKAADDFATKFPDSELRYLLYTKAMRMYQTANNPDKTEAMGRKVLALDGDDPEALLTVSELIAEKTRDTDLDRDQRFADAVKMSQKALQTIDTGIHVPAGTTQDKLDNYKSGLRSQAYSILGAIEYNKSNYPAAQENQGLYISAEQMKKAVEPFEKIRKAVGDRMEIMVEFHSLWNLPTAKKIARELEQYKPTWYEDPIRMNSPQALAEYARSTDVWVCASETLGSRYPYKDMLDRDAMHVVMADLCWTGGLTEGRKIAAMAETYHRPFAPHDCIGPVGFAAAIHMSFSQPNTLIQESVRAFYKGWYNELVTNMPVIKDGYVYPMEGEGLCIDLLPAVYQRPDLTVRRSNV